MFHQMDLSTLQSQFPSSNFLADSNQQTVDNIGHQSSRSDEILDYEFDHTTNQQTHRAPGRVDKHFHATDCLQG